MKLVVVLLMILALNFIEAHSGTKLKCMANSCQDCVKYSNCVWCDTRCIDQSEKMSCSKRISDSSMCQANSHGSDGSNCCNYKSQRYDIGQKFMDDCNNCTCLESGSVSCTKKVCSGGCETVDCMPGYTCVMENNHPVCKSIGGSLSCDNVRCMDGYTCVMENNRPICKSTGGSLSCDNVRCMGGYSCVMENNRPICKSTGGPLSCDNVRCIEGCSCVMENNRPVCKSTGGSSPTETTCEYNGKTYHNGDSFNSSDGCNQCSCNNGNVMCTLRACVQTCNYQGKTYKEGDSFPAEDGCNTCSCSGGQALCTLMACEISCHSDNDCDSGSYCQKESCEDNDIGVCTSRSSDMTCTTQGHDPVCGCDDRTYSNSCEAAKSCVNVKCSGECEANNSQPSQPQPAQSSQHQSGTKHH